MHCSMKLKARYVIFSCIDFYKDLEDLFGFFFITSDGREYDTREETCLMCVLIKEHFCHVERF